MAFSLLWVLASITLFYALKVYAILPIPTLQFKDRIIEDDESTDITCFIPYTEGTDVQLKIIGNVTFSKCDTSNVNNTKITCSLPVNEDIHETEFTCEATFKTRSRPKKLYLYTEPQFAECPDNVVWIAGQKNRFHCKAKGYPPPTVICNKDSTKYEEGEDFQVSKNMSGKYRCKATNFDTVVKTVTVSVQYKPQILKVTVNPPLHNEGDNVTISCEAVGDPIPMYTWNTPSTEVKFSSDNQTVTVLNLGKSHLGKYGCTAINLHGSATLEEKITLESEPRILNILVTPSTEVEKGQNITLTCEADGYPAPSYSWDTPKVNVAFSKDNRIVSIQGAEKIHEGSYNCTAKNKHGSDTMTKTITVKESDVSPQNRIGRTEPAIVTVTMLISLSLISCLC